MTLDFETFICTLFLAQFASYPLAGVVSFIESLLIYGDTWWLTLKNDPETFYLLKTNRDI